MASPIDSAAHPVVAAYPAGVSIESSPQTSDLVCPLCRAAVARGSLGCRPCHLPMTDVLRYAPRSDRGAGLARALWLRISGLVLYSGIVAWAWWQLPQTLAFVVPGAVVGGGVMHVLKGRPWIGLAVFAVVVVAVPLLLWPALGTGTFVNLTDWL